MPRWHASLVMFSGLFASMWSAAPASGTETVPFTSPQTTVSIVSSVEAVAPGQPFRLGLRQRIAPGWHTYWSNPGDAGEPPRLELALPEGGEAGELAFPSPMRIPYGPLVNFGYENEVVFPIEVTPPSTLRPGDRFGIEAAATWLVCQDICIPEEATFTLNLPVETASRPAAAMAGLITAAEAALPRPSPWRAEAGFAGGKGVLQLTGDTLSDDTVKEAFFFPAAWGVVANAAPQHLSLGPGSLSLTLTRDQGDLPERLDGVIAITDAAGSRSAYTVSAPLGPVPVVVATAALPMWQAVVFALLGGFLLNLMPCVFPILAMKAVSLAGLAGAAGRSIRVHALSYTLGVILSFLVLAKALLAVRMAGIAVAWGFQFTSPAFVTAMAWLMLALGLNLSGVYAIGGQVQLGNGLASRGGHLGSFATGVLAVLVATPCTAPFMAAAIGAAFAMPPSATLAVFLAMGIGMALPYAALSLFPDLARVLPRPGPWMVRLKQFLAFPMYGAAVWLVWVVTMQAGADGVLLALGGALLIAFGAWVLGVSEGLSGRRVLFGRGAALLAVILALAALPQVTTAAPREASADAGEPWSVARVAELRAAGRPVFVNLTAAWCITCKVNEQIALETEAVRAAFQAAKVAVLVGDWTNGDQAIAELLRSQGREGVPLYLLYPAGGGPPEILPQILTESIVLQAIEATTRTAVAPPVASSS